MTVKNPKIQILTRAIRIFKGHKLFELLFNLIYFYKVLKSFFFILTFGALFSEAKSQSALFSPLTLGYGRVNGVVYMSRNVDIENAVNGNAYTVMYTLSDIFRAELLFQHFKAFDMLPSWKTVKAQALEFNVMCMARTASGTVLFYPLAGLSWNRFNAYYTGVQDYTQMRKYAKPLSSYSSNWPGFNAGVGASYCIGACELSLQYKMRMGQTAQLHDFNIQDVQFSVFAFYTLPHFSTHSTPTKEKTPKTRRQWFKGRYFI